LPQNKTVMLTYAGMTSSARAGEGFPDGGMELDQHVAGGAGQKVTTARRWTTTAHRTSP
jgi:hypothetical protein